MPKPSKKAKQAFWERGYLAHGYWLGKERLGQVRLGPKREWDGIYRWQAPDTGATFIRFAFSGDVVAHDTERSLDVGILRALWLPYDELVARRAMHRSPLVLRCVDDYRAGSRRPLDHVTEM